MKDIGCWYTCEGWDDDDHGLGCYGWCKTRDIPITWLEIFGFDRCAQRKDKITQTGGISTSPKVGPGGGFDVAYGRPQEEMKK